ncbi:hypothetical protein PLEOSDRAFT_154771 [Pleurotus ostreatus PC15]|uniref:Uncharacterized protein n=1 Tax=Pleurotus ostreatus (strain PC15) TaxID=1137138 RepID=A0A067P2G1_PLEO1|nr:hypothetical protein PLEOSDRAFT_154771 [Pleurotus ostreatus PC15]
MGSDVDFVQDDHMTRQDFVEISQYFGELSSALHEAAEINKQIFDSLLSEGRLDRNAETGRSGRGSPAFHDSAGDEAVLLRVFDAIDSNSRFKETRATGGGSRLTVAGRDWSIQHEDYGLSRHLEVAMCLYLTILFFHIILLLVRSPRCSRNPRDAARVDRIE